MNHIYNLFGLAVAAIFFASAVQADEISAGAESKPAPGVQCILDASVSKHPHWVEAVICFNNGLTAIESTNTPDAREIVFRYENKFMATAIDADHGRIKGSEFMALLRQYTQEMTSDLKANMEALKEKIDQEKQALEDQRTGAREQLEAQAAAQAQARQDAQQAARHAAADAFFLNMMKPQPIPQPYMMPQNPGVNCTTSYTSGQAYTHCQ